MLECEREDRGKGNVAVWGIIRTGFGDVIGLWRGSVVVREREVLVIDGIDEGADVSVVGSVPCELPECLILFETHLVRDGHHVLEVEVDRGVPDEFDVEHFDESVDRL